jgi:hypothetical protein
VHGNACGKGGLKFVMNLFAIQHIQLLTQMQNEWSKKYNGDTVHWICKEISD